MWISTHVRTTVYRYVVALRFYVSQGKVDIKKRQQSNVLSEINKNTRVKRYRVKVSSGALFPSRTFLYTNCSILTDSRKTNSTFA